MTVNSYPCKLFKTPRPRQYSGLQFSCRYSFWSGRVFVRQKQFKKLRKTSFESTNNIFALISKKFKRLHLTNGHSVAQDSNGYFH